MSVGQKPTMHVPEWAVLRGLDVAIALAVCLLGYWAAIIIEDCYYLWLAWQR